MKKALRDFGTTNICGRIRGDSHQILLPSGELRRVKSWHPAECTSNGKTCSEPWTVDASATRHMLEYHALMGASSHMMGRACNYSWAKMRLHLRRMPPTQHQ